MTNWEKDKIKLNNIGVVTIDTVNVEIIDYLKKQIKNKNKLTKANASLAGHIKDEFNISVTPEFSNFILKNIADNSITLNYLRSVNILNKDVPIYLHNLWMNFQKKYEFNPLHEHTGLFSFIIFMQIPYKFENEVKYFPVTNNEWKNTSCLSFIYTSTDGIITEQLCKVDESYLYKMLLFPAKLKHMVYPFYTSNKERITVSGNVKFLVQ